MKTYIKWSHLTNSQKAEVKSFYQEEIEKKELFEHTLNKQVFLVDLNGGGVIFRKDF